MELIQSLSCENSTSTLECLRESSEEDFRLASNAVWESYQLGPTFDDFFIPDLPSILISQGKFAKIPIMAGHTTYDAFIQLQRTSPTDPAKFGDSADAFWNALGTNARTRLANMTGDAGGRALVEAQYPPPEDSHGEFPVCRFHCHLVHATNLDFPVTMDASGYSAHRCMVRLLRLALGERITCCRR